MKKGDQVVVWIGSANRYETQFDDAETFIVSRSPNKHLAFGHGIHFCLGALQARLEAHVALPVILERMKGIQMTNDARLHPISSSLVYGTNRLNITFTPSSLQ